MSKNTKTLALVLALLLLCTVFVGCKPESNSSLPDTPSDVSKEESQTNPFAHLEEFDYGGAEIVFLVEGDFRGLYQSSEVLGSETAPDLINDAVDERNKKIEELLGIVIKEQRTEASVSMTELIRQSESAQDNSFDVIMPYAPDAAALISDGHLTNLLNFDIFRFENDYWDNNALKYLSVADKLFFAIGDLNLLAFDCTHALAFNKTVLKSFDIDEDPYELVKQGKWTLDKLLEMAAVVTSETDGDGKMTYKDTWGFFVNSNYATSLFLGSGLTLIGRDSNDMPTLAVSENASAAAAVVEKIVDAFSNERTTIHIESFIDEAAASGTTVWIEATKALAENRALFRSMAIVDMNDLVEYNVDFGILPTPKIYDTQDDYYSFVSTLYTSCVAIPSQLETKERSAVIIEAMNAASGQYVKSKYYDVLLKSRRVDDGESAEMLDIIFANRIYDLGVIYNWGGSNTWDPSSIGNFINVIAASGENTFISSLETIEGVVLSAMEKTIETFKELD